jgi:hypothetical protein
MDEQSSLYFSQTFGDDARSRRTVRAWPTHECVRYVIWATCEKCTLGPFGDISHSTVEAVTNGRGDKDKSGSQAAQALQYYSCIIS